MNHPCYRWTFVEAFWYAAVAAAADDDDNDDDDDDDGDNYDDGDNRWVFILILWSHICIYNAGWV